MADEYVHDSRNGRVLGPFVEGDGVAMAESLNRFVADMAGIVEPPFVVHGDNGPIYGPAPRSTGNVLVVDGGRGLRIIHES